MAKKNAKNKFKFKLTKELIFLILGLVAIIVATIVLAIPSKASKETARYNDAIEAYNTNNSTSYTELTEDNHYVYVGDSDVSNVEDVASIDDMISKIASEGFTYIFYGSLSDSTTLEYLATIDSVADDKEVGTVYFFEANWYMYASENDEDDTESFEKLLESNNEKFNTGKEIEGEFSLDSYPALLVFKDKKLVFCSQDYEDSDEYNWDMYILQAFNKARYED